MDSDDYWNTSLNKSFSFDDDFEEKLFADDISEKSQVSSSHISLSVFINDDDMQKILEDQMMNEPVVPKVSLEDEVRILRRKLNEINYFCPISTTVTNLLMGKPCLLNIYKSLKEKEELLDEVISCGNGDAILQAVMFLKDTLNQKLFHQVISPRSQAVDHYVNYLSTTMKISESSDLFVLLGRHKEAALLQLKVAALAKNADERLQKLKRVQQLICQFRISPFLNQQVRNNIALLEMQINERLHFQEHADIHDKSVIETLYYACSKFQKWFDPTAYFIANPFKIMEQFSVSPAQFEWVVLIERGRSQAWRDIEGLFENKSWHNFKQKSFAINIPLELAIIQLHHLNAPQALLNSFLYHVDDPERRLILAKKVGASHAAIDAFVQLKDKTGLKEFKENLITGTEEYFYAEKAVLTLVSSKSILGLGRKTSSTS